MPEHINDAAGAKGEETDQRKRITGRQGFAPAEPFADIAKMAKDQREASEPDSAVKKSVPRRKEAVIHLAVVMRPAIDVQAKYNGAGAERHDPIQSDAVGWQTGDGASGG